MKSSEASRLLFDCEFLSEQHYHTLLERALENTTLTHIVTLNAEMVVEAQRNEAFRNAVEHAELKIPDGGSMLWAKGYLAESHARPDRAPTPARRFGGWIPAGVYPRLRSGAGMTISLIKFLFSKQQPLTGVDSIFTICKILEKNNGSAYLLGGTEKQAQGTMQVLQKKYPGLKFQIISETLLSEERSKLTQLKKLVKLTGPSVLFVALGAPKQTLWIEANRNLLEKSGIKIAIGVGGAFAMISGELPRAPKILRRFHLEWLWRLILEPKRIKRIWNAVVAFPALIYQEYNKK